MSQIYVVYIHFTKLNIILMFNMYQVLGDLEEFENAVKLVARDVSFDTDVIVSLFETNIRMLG